MTSPFDADQPARPCYGPPLVRAQLLTKALAPVVAVYVLPMDPMPEVLVWGERSFVRRADGVYVEGLMYIVAAGHDSASADFRGRD